MDTGLSDHATKELKEVFQKFPKVKRVTLFGSRAMGNFHEGSDIDLVLEGDVSNLKELLNIQIELDALGYPYKYDLLLKDKITNQKLLEHIARVGKTIYLKQ